MVEYKSTDILISPPAIPDPRFRKCVMMLTHDHEGGSFALCLNRPSRYDCNDILKQMPIGDNINLPLPLYWGGPVSPSTIWMLHSSEWKLETHTVEINEHWSMTSNEKMFYMLEANNQPLHFRLVFGFCSWAPSQLEAELRGLPPWNPKHSWLVAKNPGPEWLFEQPVENLWDNATTLCSHQAVDSWF